MSNIQKIFFGITLGLLIALILSFITMESTIYSFILLVLIAMTSTIYDVGFPSFKKDDKYDKAIDSEDDMEHITWIYNRLKLVYGDEGVYTLEQAYDRLLNKHGENANYDFMIRLKKIIDKYKK